MAILGNMNDDNTIRPEESNIQLSQTKTSQNNVGQHKVHLTVVTTAIVHQY